MESVVTALQTAVSTTNMFSTLADLIPVVGGVLVFAFSYRMIKKIITGASKGKARI